MCSKASPLDMDTVVTNSHLKCCSLLFPVVVVLSNETEGSNASAAALTPGAPLKRPAVGTADGPQESGVPNQRQWKERQPNWSAPEVLALINAKKLNTMQLSSAGIVVTLCRQQYINGQRLLTTSPRLDSLFITEEPQRARTNSRYILQTSKKLVTTERRRVSRGLLPYGVKAAKGAHPAC
jgi:hypothetical protein